MTISEFAAVRNDRPCESCGTTGVVTQLNPNNNGLLVCCPHCGSKRPWGSLLYLKQNERRRPARTPLPDGETLDSIWEKFGNRCVVCSAPKSFLLKLGIGRQVHHVAPYAQEGHRGPLVPICAHCHSVATERQRVYWFYQRVVLKTDDEVVDDRYDNDAAAQQPRTAR
jgi:ribosomal protein S14